MSRVRLVATATALLSPMLLAGCGIKPTGVIDSGTAATVVVPAPGAASLVYFVSPEGRLVPFPLKDTPPMPAYQVVNRLLEGPGPEERAAGLSTQLPSISGKRLDPAVVEYSERQTLSVRLPFHVGDLTPTAHRQLVCSIASTASPRERLMVAVQGTDGSSLDPAGCDTGR